MSDRTYSIWRFRIPLPNGKWEHRTLYYYNGNFFYPMFNLPNAIMRRIKVLRKEFIKNNAELVKQDRDHPDYRTKLKLAIEQGL